MVRGRRLLDRAGGILRLAMLERHLEGARDRLARTARLLDAVNPDILLKRGYVRVSARGGAVVTTAAAARAAGAITLHFGDGAVDARVERGAASGYDKAKMAPSPKPEQPSLL